MISLTHRKNQKIFVLGLGLSGRSTVNSLIKGGAEVYAWDDNQNIRKTYSDTNNIITDPDEINIIDYDAIILSPGINFNNLSPHRIVNLAKNYKIPILGDIQLFMDELKERNLSNKVIMVTGTNGKSTTVMLIYHLLKKLRNDVQVGGNIGSRSVLEFDISNEDTIFIIEISSYQIELCQNIEPNIAILLNISPDHLDRHGSFKNYINIKFDLFSGQGKDDYAIFGLDGGVISETIGLKEIQAKTIFIDNPSCKDSLKENENYDGEKTIYFEKNKEKYKYLLEYEGFLNNTTNIENIAAAVACMEALDFRYQNYVSYFKTFKNLKHRAEHVLTYNKIDFINDSKATNAFASRLAIQSYKNIFWILGGIKKYGGISEIKDSFYNIKKAYLIGHAAESFSDFLISCGIENEICHTLDIAFIRAIRDARAISSKATVLLSPACASFDQYRNFEERGNKFCNLINNMKSNEYED
ncbi:MAG: UDP-N-acetylmuramoyl-L-alanine--D-glutamate ligase [Hyphomicrobiales bacterium]|jgi:UDP-N-acetylmuramoylalanine--D-glutamate ligase|nr:UDP-N-acetylmuramoyl-L-alanine--D-glutamate ligase [Hyphomicrobiales bacterium]